MTRPTNRLRWFQWRLRTLLGVMTLCAVAAGLFIGPRVRERAVVTWLHEMDANIAFEPEGPEWLRQLIGDQWLQRVVAVEIREKPITGADLPRLNDLRRLRTLHCMDSVLCEFITARFSDPWRPTPVTTSYLSVADVEAFADRRPEVDCDIAFAESLYHASLREHQSKQARLRDVLFACHTAVKWKMACGEYKAQPTATIAGHKELVTLLERIKAQVDANVSAGIEGVLVTDVALAECALLKAKLKLAQAQRRTSAERAAANEGMTVATDLLRMIDPTPVNGPIDPYQLDIAWSILSELLVAKRRLDGETDAERIVLKQHAEAFGALGAKIGSLFTAGARGGETDKFDLARVNIALVEAGLAQNRGDKNAERRALKNALPIAARLRQAVKAAYDVGVITTVDLLYAEARATELETACAQATCDAEMQRSVNTAHTEFLEQVWRRKAALQFTAVRGDYSLVHDEWLGCLFRCLSALHRIKQEGRTAFDAHVDSFAPRDEAPDVPANGDEMPQDDANGESMRAGEIAPPARDDFESPMYDQSH